MADTIKFDFPAQKWRLIDDGAHHVHLGLAIDEMLFERLEKGVGNQQSTNTVRFYQFSLPSVVVGCHQDIREIDLAFVRSRDLHLGRRITGGGAIIMGVPRVDSQLGISVLFNNVPGFPVKLGGRYEALSRPIVSALRRLGLPVEYQHNSDITLHGRKITGQAIYTSPTTTFMHSTITIEYDLETMLRIVKIPVNDDNIATFSGKFTTIRAHLPHVSLEQVKQALKAEFEVQFNADLEQRPLNDAEMSHARRLLEEKHATDAYLLETDGARMGSCFL